MCQVLKNNLDKRFVLEAEHICAAVLTPALMNLSLIDNWLKSKNLGKVDFLRQMMNKYVGDSMSLNATVSYRQEKQYCF